MYPKDLYIVVLDVSYTFYMKAMKRRILRQTSSKLASLDKIKVMIRFMFNIVELSGMNFN